MSIQEKREHLAGISRQMNALLAAQGNRAWGKDTQAKFDALGDELERGRQELQDMEDALQVGRSDGFQGNSHHSFQGNGSGAAEGSEPRVLRATSPTFMKDVQAQFKSGNSGRAPYNLSELCSAIANGARTKNPALHAALTEGTDTAGGFTVPGPVMYEILPALAAGSSMLSVGAGVYFPDQGAKSYNWAGINALPTAAWRNENGAVAESDPTFRNVQAVPRSLSFMFKVSRELLADSPNLNAALRIVIGQAFAKEIDRAGLRGSGTAPEPRGILNTAGIQAVTNGANGASLGTTRYANVMSAIQATLQADAPMPTAAIMSPRSRVTLAGLLDTTNQPMAVPPLVSDLKLAVTSQIPNNLTVGTSTDCTEIYVGDFTKVIFVIRENPSIQLADQLYAATGQVAFICHARVDVIVEYPQALSVITGVRA